MKLFVRVFADLICCVLILSALISLAQWEWRLASVESINFALAFTCFYHIHKYGLIK